MSEPVPLTRAVASGAWGAVECAVRASGKSPAHDFLLQDLVAINEKSKDDPAGTAYARFLVLFQTMANYGRVSGKRFGKEMGSLFGFKHEVRKVQIRFPCFPDGNRWILTHGFIKPGAQKKLGEWPASEVKRANEIMIEYFERKKARENK